MLHSREVEKGTAMIISMMAETPVGHEGRGTWQAACSGRRVRGAVARTAGQVPPNSAPGRPSQVGLMK